jgi:hypothetical protein
MSYVDPQSEDDARAAIELAMAPWGGSAGFVDSYETSMRALTEMQRTVAGVIDLEPARSIAAGCADLTRDLAATQVSSARWLLDV